MWHCMCVTGAGGVCEVRAVERVQFGGGRGRVAGGR